VWGAIWTSQVLLCLSLRFAAKVKQLHNQRTVRNDGFSTPSKWRIPDQNLGRAEWNHQFRLRCRIGTRLQSRRALTSYWGVVSNHRQAGQALAGTRRRTPPRPEQSSTGSGPEGNDSRQPRTRALRLGGEARRAGSRRAPYCLPRAGP